MRYLTIGLLIALGGCVAQVRVAGPPPPPVYVRPAPPPPPAYVPANVEVEVQANEAPPPLPEYEQPPCPDDGYIWTPGYWHYGAAGYYWVPGTWVEPPQVG
ncbi:MAG TPA: YXWGXW repeat-containing protein, partial [Steroidobacteraceae bacterium]